MSDVTVLASDLRLSVHRLTRMLRAQRPNDGLTLSQLSALVTIYREGPVSAGDVAAREGVKPPSATRVLAVLEERGLITRAPGTTDARRVLLTITDAGRSRVDEDLHARDVWLARRLATLTPEQREVLTDAMGLLRDLAEP